MKDRASQTAAMVAAARALGAQLPPQAQLAADPDGFRFVHPTIAAALRERGAFTAALRLPGPLRRWIVYMQVRTRVIDDALREFVAAGGRQVLLLGAGYDCRAHRLAEHLEGAAVFEVDHPATQRRKRKILDSSTQPRGAARYLPWDFERQPMADLPAALAAAGHKASEPTLVVWEGVTMYLTKDAIEATVAAVRVLGAAGSRLVFTYFDRAHVLGQAPIPSATAHRPGPPRRGPAATARAPGQGRGRGRSR